MARPSLVLFALALSGLVACSTGSEGGTGDGDGGTTQEGGGGTGEGGGGGTGGGTGGGGGGGGGGGVTLNGCTTFLDESGPSGARKIEWDLTLPASPTRCMKIKKGQTIAFEGDFTAHPLGAAGGDTPSPFASVPATGKVTFAATGTFGFVCGLHPSMTGAVAVIE